MKVEILHIAQDAGLPEITGLLHDRWFRACDARTIQGPIRLFFWERANEVENLAPSYELVIDHVVEVNLQDTEFVSFYDFNEIFRVDERLVISTGVPLKCEFEISSLELTVFQLDDR